jgi:hypothetical protein
MYGSVHTRLLVLHATRTANNTAIAKITLMQRGVKKWYKKPI